MLKNSECTPTKIDINFENKEDINNLLKSNDFKSFIIINAFETIKKAIEKDLEEVELFNIFNLFLKVKIHKDNYLGVLNKALSLYEENEDYNECIKIKQLINKIS